MITKGQFKKLWKESGIEDACEANRNNPEVLVVDEGMSPQLAAHFETISEFETDEEVIAYMTANGIWQNPDLSNVRS